MDEKHVGTAKSLECPFRWGLDEKSSLSYDESKELPVELEEQPFLAIMQSVMITYFRAVQKNFEGALQNLEKAADMFQQVKGKLEEDNVSAKVLFHVMEATKHDLYITVGEFAKAKEVMNKLCDSKSFQFCTELGTLNGCKVIAFMNFHEAFYKSSLSYAKKAVYMSPSCALWHYLLYKNLRYMRRYELNELCPCAEERNSILKCYKLSSIPFYAIQVAQMFRESGRKEMCQQMYDEVYLSNPSSCIIKLRLARAYIQLKVFDKAEVCLDYAEKLIPTNSMFLHYKGIYFEKKKNFREAAKYFGEAAKYENFRAEIQYATSMMRSDENFDIIKYLQSMVLKYQHKTKDQQRLLLYITMQYHFKKKDDKNAMIYLLRAIQLDPDAKQLTEFWETTTGSSWTPFNIFEFLQELLIKFESCNPEMSADEQRVFNELELISKDHRREKN